MEQLQFPFMLKRYDITTDSYVALTQEYVDMLEEVQQAYGRIRLAAQRYDSAVPVSELDMIHLDLRKRISVST